jgi:hypothetical protein
MQYGRPNSDIRTGIFAPSTGVTLFGCIDESSPSDADYISGGGSIDYAEVGLSSVTDPVSSTGHFVNYRIARNPTNRAITLVVRLMQGATEIASWSHANYNGPGTFNQELSGAQTDAITNYGTLSLRFDITSTHASGVSFVYWAEFAVPDAATPINVTPSTGELTSTGYAPTVTVTNNINILTSTGELILTGYAPLIAITGNNINIITSTGELILTGFAPTVSTTFEEKYLVTKTGYYITYNNKLLTVQSSISGDIILLQENSGTYTEIEITTTTTPPTFE